MKQKVIILLTILMSFSFADSAKAQMFKGRDIWLEDVIVIGKWSQLFYEANVGWNVNQYGGSKADFLYFGLGVGYPINTENAWRKFLPKQQIPTNEEEAELFGSMNTNNVYGGKLGMGWIHYFNHIIGLYTQVSWGFLGDFGTPSSDDSSTTTDSDGKKIFIYNTVPVELGICINCWKHLHIQGGVTYMWKEIPLLTLGVGATF